MKKIVKCPLCGKLSLTRGKHYFRCCQMAWDIEKHQITSYDEGRYRVQPKPRDQMRPDIESVKPIIRKILQEELRKGGPAKQEEEDKLIEKMKKDRQLRYYVKEILRERRIPVDDE